MDSTGTLIQRVGKSRYVFFGSADRKVYIRSYPDLNPVGELKMHLPPGTRTQVREFGPILFHFLTAILRLTLH